MAGILLLMDVSSFRHWFTSCCGDDGVACLRTDPFPHPHDRRPSRVYSAKNCNVYCSAATSPYKVSASLRSFTTERMVRSRGIDPFTARNTSLFYLVWNCPLSCRSFGSVAPQDSNLDHKVTETSNSAYSAFSTFQKNIMSYQHTSVPQPKYGYTWQ